jgi:hypothetical protein
MHTAAGFPRVIWGVWMLGVLGSAVIAAGAAYVRMRREARRPVATSGDDPVKTYLFGAVGFWLVWVVGSAVCMVVVSLIWYILRALRVIES